MKNRYGDEYSWEKLSDKEYKFVMEGNSLEYASVGGKEGQSGIDYNALGMFDPSGGPYVTLGGTLDGGVITHIRHTEEGFVVTVGDTG